MNDSDPQMSRLCWTTTAALLGFLRLAHPGVLLSYAASGVLSPWVVPVSSVAALLIADRLGHQAGLSVRSRIWALGLVGS